MQQQAGGDLQQQHCNQQPQLLHATQPLPYPTCGQLCPVIQLAGRAGSQLFCRPKGAEEQAGLLVAVQGGVRQAGGFCSLVRIGGSICRRVGWVRRAAGV